MQSGFQPRRHSLRLQNYDYAAMGAYFVTICTKNRRNLFGEIEQGEMVLNTVGKIVQEELVHLPTLRNDLELDQFIVMPNHLHAILFISGTVQGTASRASRLSNFGKPISGSLSTIIGGFKSGVTRRIRRMGDIFYGGLWQRGFFEHVIRNDESLDCIREYILTNPLRWDLDRENSQRSDDDEFDRWLRGF